MHVVIYKQYMIGNRSRCSEVAALPNLASHLALVLKPRHRQPLDNETRSRGNGALATALL